MDRLVQAQPTNEKTKLQRRHLVQSTAEKMRDLILAHEPDAQIGSLTEVAQRLGVGIVTVQQAARILEHEGLLEVRRGPGGGYYGARPDDAALERSVAAYLRVHGSAYREVSEMMSLLDCELMPAAARCDNEELHEALRGLHARIDQCDTPEERISMEEELHNIVFRMVNRPLIEMLARVTARVAKTQPAPLLFPGEQGVAAWKRGRKRIVQAIVDRDAGLAMFEAVRYRQGMLERLSAARGEAPGPSWSLVPD